MVSSHNLTAKMPNNPEEHGLLEQLGKSFQPIYVILTLLVVPLWKWIDSYFSYKKERDRDFIKSAAKEGVKEEMIAVNAMIVDIKEDIKGIIKQAEQDRKDTNKQLMDIIKEQRK